MAFAQMTCRESLRAIESCLRAVPAKLYHLGIRGTVSRTTLANANEQRDWHVFADFAQVLIAEARELYAKDTAVADLTQTIYGKRPMKPSTNPCHPAFAFSVASGIASRSVPG